jgi:hypothetical protein
MILDAVHPEHLWNINDAITSLQQHFQLKERYIPVGHSCGATLAFQTIMRRWPLEMNLKRESLIQHRLRQSLELLACTALYYSEIWSLNHPFVSNFSPVLSEQTNRYGKVSALFTVNMNQSGSKEGLPYLQGAQKTGTYLQSN